MDESIELHTINLLVRTCTIVLLLRVLPRLLRERRRHNPLLDGLTWTFLGMLGTFGVLWIGRLESILDFIPRVDLLGVLRAWTFVPELIMVYGLHAFARSLRSGTQPMG